MRNISKAFSLAFIVGLCFHAPAVAQKPWLPVGKQGLSAGAVTYTSLVFGKNDTPYIAYGDYSKGLKATVMKYDGTQWEPVGGEGFSAGWVALTKLAFDKNGTPYLAFEEFYNGGYRTTVMKYINGSWQRVGVFGPYYGLAVYMSLVIDKAGDPYVSFRDNGAGFGASVAKYNGTGWSYVGNPGFSGNDVHFISMAIDKNDTLYVAYHEVNNGYKATVMKYDGTQWVTVGNAGFTPGAADNVSLALDNNGTPFVAFTDHTRNKKATVMKYDGTQWVTVGNAGFSTGSVAFISLKTDNNGIPFIAFQDHSDSNKATVMKFNGNKWVNVGNAAFSGGGTEFHSLAIDNSGIPHVAYRDYADSSQATVMKYTCPYPEPQVDICAVLTDTAAGNNVIVWDGSSVPYVDSYWVFREDNGVYNMIGAVPGNVNTFTDLTVTPSAKSYKYKLTVSDSCHQETDVFFAIMHNSIRLVFNYLFNGQASISWNSYTAKPGAVYKVMRSNNSGPFTAIDSFSIAGNDTTYIDNNPPSGSNRYRIDISLTNPCNAGAVTYDKITSNVVTSWNTGIEKTTANNSISVVPNPAMHKLKIKSEVPIVKVEIFSVAGRKIIAVVCNSEKEMVIDVSDAAPGMYIIKVNDVHRTLLMKH